MLQLCPAFPDLADGHSPGLSAAGILELSAWSRLTRTPPRLHFQPAFFMLDRMQIMDRIAYFRQRAALGEPLFGRADRCIVLSAEYWTAKNGFRHIIRLVKLIAGKEIVESRLHPTQDPRRLAMCQEKREYRLANLEATRAADRARKARSRGRLRAEQRLRKAAAGRRGKTASLRSGGMAGMKQLDADSPRGTLLGWLSYTVDLAAEFSRAGPDHPDAAELDQRLNWAGAHLAEALCIATDSGRKTAIRSAG
jgi:hypothetical protein